MANRDEKTKELYDNLKTRSAELMNTARFQAYLKSAARFHRYSANNQWLIFFQAPEAVAINSYKRWQELGRQVRKGEMGIRIIAPVPVKFTEVVHGEEQDRSFTRFRSVAVFDYAQTDPIEGFENPWEPITFPLLTGQQGQEAYNTLADWLTNDHIDVSEEEIAEHSAAGYYNIRANKIVVEATHEPLQKLATLLHEAAHALHWTKYQEGEGENFKKRAYREIVAESVAYIAAEAIGLDTSEHADMYVGIHAVRQPELLDAALPIVQKIAHDLIEAIQRTEEVQVAA